MKIEYSKVGTINYVRILYEYQNKREVSNFSLSRPVNEWAEEQKKDKAEEQRNKLICIITFLIWS